MCITQVYNNLVKNSKGKPENSYSNILYVFNNDPNLKNLVRTNEFTRVKEIFQKPIWRKDEDNSEIWTDEDEAQLFVYLGENYEITNMKVIRNVLDKQFYDNKYNPIKDYLNTIEWDEKPRVETLFIDYLGAEDNKYVREVTKLSLVGAIRRVMEPGCKHDTVLVLVGGQGIGKSTILLRLGMKWFNNSLDSFNGDEAYIKISGSWIVELAELSGLSKSEIETVKAFISSQEDVYRPKYGRNPIHAPRKCIFFGTTNNYEFLVDETGERRWYPVEVNAKRRKYDVFTDFTQENVDQVWAEAFYLYNHGAKSYITNPEIVKTAIQIQQQYKQDNGLKGMIEEFLQIPIFQNWYDMSIEDRKNYYKRELYKIKSDLLVPRKKVCAIEIWREYLQKTNDMTRKDAAEINQILRNLDYLEEKRERFGQYGQQRGFIFKKF